MVRRVGLIAAAAATAALAIVTAASARPDAVTSASASKAIACGKSVTIGMMAPITGPAASIGDDQLHWAQFYVNIWNNHHKKRLKLNLVQGDTQLDPSKGSVVAQQFASNSKMMGVIGPASSSVVEAVAADPEEGGPRVRVRLGDPRVAHGRPVQGLLLP